MRTLLVLGAAVLGACNTFPVMAEPRIQVSPYFATYQLRGNASLQNDPGTGPQDNAPQSLRTFGSGHHENDVGVRVDIGDGFVGARLDYYRMSMNTSRTGVLPDEFGSLQNGDVVRMSSTMDEWRVSWTESVLSAKTTYRDQPLDLRLGLGGVWAHRDLTLHMRTNQDNLRAQDVGIAGDSFYPTARFRAQLRNVALDVEYAISPHLSTGAFDGVQQDLEARLSYTVPFQDVTLFGGFRYSTLEADGLEGGLAYDADLRLNGFQFGVLVNF
ncbi:MAG: hypothetical protein AB7O97_24520 [Planctomycetota bacterium]